MKIRKALLALPLAFTAIPAAFAANFVGGELGYDTDPINSALTRQQVQREYQAFREHPVFFDGTVMLQGEAGYVSANQGAFADRIPNGPNSHVLGNAPTSAVKPAPLSDAERRAYREQYIN